MQQGLREFYRERYDYEVTRRAELTNTVSIPIGILTVLAGSIAVSLKDLRVPLGAEAVFHVIVAVIGLSGCLVAAYFLVRSIYGYTYHYLAAPKDIECYHKRLLSYYQQIGESDAEGKAEKESLSFISDRYVACAHENTKNNDKKSWYLHRANEALIVSLVFGVISGAVFFYRSMHQPPTITKVELLNLKDISRMTQSNTTQSPNTPSPSPAPVPAVTPPDPPPDRLIKEDQNPNKIRR